MEKKELLNKAYENYLKFIEEDDFIKYVSQSHKDLKDEIYNTEIESFDIDFINKFFIGERANHYSAEGSAKTTRPSYYDFMEDDKTKKIIKDYIYIRRKFNSQQELFRELKDNAIFCHLGKCNNLNKKPQLYVNRMMIILFPEVCTTVANYGDLKKVAEALGIYTGNEFNKSIFNIHYQIRGKIESNLKENGVDISKLHSFELGAIAWQIKELL